jgi:hypothetical protein
MEKSSEHHVEKMVPEKGPDQEAGAVTSNEFPDFSSIDEAAVLRKMDLRLIPMLSVLYLLAFLDRGNIGNAKIEGLVEDLHMTGPQYNWTCMSFSFHARIFMTDYE